MVKKNNKSGMSKKLQDLQAAKDNEGPVIPADPPKGSRFEIAIAAFFTSFIILIVRMADYERPMQQFYWSGGTNQFSDFFSYYKMAAIITVAVLTILVILYRITTATFRIRRSYAYIFMAVYTAFVILSYIFSDYKDFALYGYNDRFEGTLVLISYMIMLYFIYNLVISERNAKGIIYFVAAASVPLGLLGLSQGIDHDFFRTTIGKKLITPSSFWEHTDTLNFTFQNREIYQTVYNINYVSFYITLIIPLFGLMFIREKQTVKKVIWGCLFALAIYNLIGSSSSGGFLGMGAVIVIALVMFNKRLIKWIKPFLILIAITILMGSLTMDRWIPELSHAIKGVIGAEESVRSAEKESKETGPENKRPRIDYIETGKDFFTMSIYGEPLKVQISFYEDGKIEGLTLHDKDNKPIAMIPAKEESIYSISDDRFFDHITLSYAADDENYYVLMNTEEMQWAFLIREEGILYMNQMGKPARLSKVEAIGWKSNQGFGSGRGYIWSRTLPMLKETLLIGHGADTYCIYFPHNDYAGKYSAGWDINKVVDKPHNMYMGMAIGTGIVSLIALILLFGTYLVQSFRLYFQISYESFISYAGAGIFLGIFGFLIAGLVNDSSVSVMPMFYGLLGTGMGINSMISSELQQDRL